MIGGSCHVKQNLHRSEEHILRLRCKGEPDIIAVIPAVIMTHPRVGIDHGGRPFDIPLVDLKGNQGGGGTEPVRIEYSRYVPHDAALFKVFKYGEEFGLAY